jgi:hypothetical protein
MLWVVAFDIIISSLESVERMNLMRFLFDFLQWKNDSIVRLGSWRSSRNRAHYWVECEGIQKGSSQHEMLGYRYVA